MKLAASWPSVASGQGSNQRTDTPSARSRAASGRVGWMLVTLKSGQDSTAPK
jgi:hypothetical protein